MRGKLPWSDPSSAVFLLQNFCVFFFKIGFCVEENLLRSRLFHIGKLNNSLLPKIHREAGEGAKVFWLLNVFLLHWQNSFVCFTVSLITL